MLATKLIKNLQELVAIYGDHSLTATTEDLDGDRSMCITYEVTSVDSGWACNDPKDSLAPFAVNLNLHND